MILQLGGLFSGLVTGLGGLIQAAAPAALDVGKAFLQRELQRKLQKDAQRRAAAAVRQQANLFSPTVALGQTPVPVGGRVVEPVGFPATIVPPSTAPAFLPAAGGVIPGVGRMIGRQAIQTGVEFAVRTLAGRRAASPLNGVGLNGVGVGVGPMPTLPGAVGEPRFARDETGRVVKFVASPVPGEGFVMTTSPRGQQILATGNGGPLYRFNRLRGIFQKIKARRMNPLNFSALTRARRRQSAALRVCRTLFTEARREKTGRVRPKAVRRRKKK